MGKRTVLLLFAPNPSLLCVLGVFHPTSHLPQRLARATDLLCGFVFFFLQKAHNPGSRKPRFHGKRLTGQLARDLPILGLFRKSS